MTRAHVFMFAAAVLTVWWVACTPTNWDGHVVLIFILLAAATTSRLRRHHHTRSHR